MTGSSKETGKTKHAPVNFQASKGVLDLTVRKDVQGQAQSLTIFIIDLTNNYNADNNVGSAAFLSIWSRK